MITLMAYMADQAEYDKGDMAYATEKPWKFETVFHEAVRTASEGNATSKLMLNSRYGKRAAMTQADWSGVNHTIRECQGINCDRHDELEAIQDGS